MQTFLLHIVSCILLLFIFGTSLLNKQKQNWCSYVLYPQGNLETAASVSMLLPLLTLKMRLLSCAEVLHHHNAATGVHKQTCNTTHRRTSAWNLAAGVHWVDCRSVDTRLCFINYIYVYAVEITHTHACTCTHTHTCVCTYACMHAQTHMLTHNTTHTYTTHTQTLQKHINNT